MTSIQTCSHILTRGSNKGKRCPFNRSIGNEFCCRHKSKKECSICMEAIKKTGNCVLDCGHEFHLECLFELYRQSQNFANKCPLCRKEYTQKNNYTEKEFYLTLFKKYYKGCEHICPYEWLPKWIDQSNPSGRLILASD